MSITVYLRAQVLHFFYDLTSVEQVRHLGCYRTKQGKGASRKHICSSNPSNTHIAPIPFMHTCFGACDLRLLPALVKLACDGPQEKREDAALQLASAMAKSQKSYDGLDVRSNGGVASKKALSALRRCSPLTVCPSCLYEFMWPCYELRCALNPQGVSHPTLWPTEPAEGLALFWRRSMR